jgi:hypothetical protein
MKVAICQYYQNSTEPIIKTSSFFNKNNVELVIEAAFLEPLWKGNYKKEYKLFFPYGIRPKFWHAISMVVTEPYWEQQHW